MAKDNGKQQDEAIDAIEKQEDEDQAERHRTRGRFGRSPSHTVAKYCPLVASILAPLTTLLDIPGLTQHWYSYNGVAQPDPTTCLALSALGLCLNVLANALLIVRFSAKKAKWWRMATRLSLIFWIAKTIIAVVNLIIFGVTTRNTPGYQYVEGFWCAVVSVIGSGIITLTLLWHYFFAFEPELKAGDDDDGASQIRRQGSKFMLSVTFLMAILAIQSLVFCKIEAWAYSDAIYFSIQTALTIGYGDFTPTTTAGKVLIFPFAVLTISQLGNEITIVIAFLSSRAEERRDRWRNRYEGAMQKEAARIKPNKGLIEEMALIYEIGKKEEMMSQMYDLFWSGWSLIVFWMIGATMFSQIEGWPFGDAVYAVMILSLTIGYGDYSPVQPAGKVVFVVYALMAVPIVTSFAVQTITGLLSTYSERGSTRETFRKQQRDTPEAFSPHSDFVLGFNKAYKHIREKMMGEDEGEEDTDQDSETIALSPKQSRKSEPEPAHEPSPSKTQQNVEQDKQIHSTVSNMGRTETVDEIHQGDPMDVQRVELDLLRQLMNRMIQLEAEARQMLLDSLDKGVARTVLLADRNGVFSSPSHSYVRLRPDASSIAVQERDVKAIRGDDRNMQAIWRGEERQTKADQEDSRKTSPDEKSGGPQDMLSRVKRYRNTFAEILVLGSILQRLKGEDLKMFERWRDPKEIEGGRAENSRPGETADLDEVADDEFDGITGKLFRLQARRMTKDLKRVLSHV
ncbi:hypothetical protein P7C73_g3079, partial [Tremellales sp. Uapishka_1]